MSLERTLVEALHQADGYQPSPDLFARVTRSIEEDRAHRRRLGLAGLSVVVSLLAILGLLRSVGQRSASGDWVVPMWSIEIIEGAVLIALLLGLGPVLRRFGQPYLADVFHLSPPTGLRFSRLLDIAYYLFFAGVILVDVDLVSLGSLLPPQVAFAKSLSRFGFFLTAMGLAHAVNLLLLPLIGLVFGSLLRRGRRRQAGDQARPVSRRAEEADRVVTWILIGLAVLFVAAAFLAVGLGVGLGL